MRANANYDCAIAVIYKLSMCIGMVYNLPCRVTTILGKNSLHGLGSQKESFTVSITCRA